VAFEELARKASQTSRSNPDARAFLRNLAAAPTNSTDAQGRITLSADHRRYANLSKDCVVIGSIEYWRSGTHWPGSSTRHP